MSHVSNIQRSFSGVFIYNLNHIEHQTNEDFCQIKLKTETYQETYETTIKQIINKTKIMGNKKK